MRWVMVELEVLKVDMLEVELGRQHVQELGLLDEAELDQAFAQGQAQGLLLGQALFELALVDIALVDE